MPPIPSSRLSLLATCVTLIGCASGGRTPADAPRPALLGLPAVIDSVRHSPPLDRTHWGVGAYDPVADRMLLRVNVDRHFIPASNMKLIVTAVALDRLGSDFRYSTTVHAEQLTGGVASALLVTGSGDPTMSARFHGQPLAALRQIADSIAAAGVRRVEGPLVVDATYFDKQYLHPSWEIGDLDWYYAAPVAAFAVEEGTVPLVVTPGAAVGQPAQLVALAPDGLITIDNRITTDTAYARNEIVFVRTPGTNQFRFTGRVPLQAAPDTVRMTTHRPEYFAGEALKALLQERGIPVTGEVTVLSSGSGEIESGHWDERRVRFQPVATWLSPPLSDIVEAILEPSQNWMAEQLLKTLGARFADAGSWSAGTEVERRWLIDVVGVDSAAFHLVDGSGLSAQNLLSPDAIMRVLYHASEADWGGIYRAALAEPGESESTLENRLRTLERRLFAKTGTITNVNSLSGYLVAADGREIIFSVLSNGSGVPASFVRLGIDEIVAALARVGTPPPPPEPRRLP